MHDNPIHELTHQHYILNGILFTPSALSQQISQNKKIPCSTKLTSYYTTQIFAPNSLSNQASENLPAFTQNKQTNTCTTDNTVPAPA